MTEGDGPATSEVLGFREYQPTCLVAQAVKTALTGAVQEAEALLLKRLAAVTLATLSNDFHHRMAQQKRLGHTGYHLPHKLLDHTRDQEH